MCSGDCAVKKDSRKYCNIIFKILLDLTKECIDVGQLAQLTIVQAKRGGIAIIQVLLKYF